MLQAEQLPREIARKHLGLPDSAWVVENVGRLHPDKDQETLIPWLCCSSAQATNWSSVGDHGEGSAIPAESVGGGAGRTDGVIFLGQIKDGRKYFKAFDVFALSSDHEPFGMVLLEAMGAGLPVIQLRHWQGCGSRVGFGLAVPIGDSAALASRLLDVAGMNESELKV